MVSVAGNANDVVLVESLSTGAVVPPQPAESCATGGVLSGWAQTRRPPPFPRGPSMMTSPQRYPVKMG
jgi:hypothetical protein